MTFIREFQQAPNKISCFLDDVGDGSGTIDARGDYSVTPKDFFIAPPNGVVYALHRMIPQIRDATGLNADRYGYNIVLTEGIDIYIERDGVKLFNPTLYKKIITNADWGAFCYDVQAIDFGAGNNYISARWTFTKSGEPLFLDGSKGDKFVVHLHDDFSGLTGHFFNVQGDIAS